jgi:hypothetical protein
VRDKAGDVIETRDSNGRRQRVTDVRARIPTVDTTTNDIPLISTVNIFVLLL